MYVCLCEHVRVHVCVCLYVCVCVYGLLCMCVVRVSENNKYVRACVRACVRTCICMRMHAMCNTCTHIIRVCVGAYGLIHAFVRIVVHTTPGQFVLPGHIALVWNTQRFMSATRPSYGCL